MGRIRWVGLAILAAGCATARPPKLVEADEAYRIGREDVIEVSIFQAPDLSRTVPVRPDGKISLPLLGDVEAAGLTAADLAESLRGKLDGLVHGPRVTVIVHEINAARVYVIGEVAHPGAFPIRGRMDVIQALALAGGLGDFASRGKLMLIRKGNDGDERYVLDYDDLLENAASVPRLLPGDTLYVP